MASRAKKVADLITATSLKESTQDSMMQSKTSFIPQEELAPYLPEAKLEQFYKTNDDFAINEEN